MLKLKDANFTNIRNLFQSNKDINKMVLSNKGSFGKKALKYFIGYKDTKK